MIDLGKAKEKFKEYVNKYDVENENILRKIGHSYRVMENSKMIAESLNLAQEEKEICILIGLLHDIGRFEQYKRFATYRDEISIDHGMLGVKILQKDEYIRNYIEINEYDTIIFKEIKAHNQFEIPEEYTPKEKFFTKIIRDADKLDILKLATEEFWEEKHKLVGEIHPEIKKQFYQNRTIRKTKEISFEGVNDIILKIALVFDIQFKKSLEIIKKEDYINKIMDRFSYEEKTKEELEKMKEKIENWIQNKMEEQNEKDEK